MDANRGVIVGDGVVLVSDDNGLNWRKLASAPEGLWVAGVTMNSREATVVGQAGTIQVLDLDDNDSKTKAESR
jgi:photosystem II stability/assembly factor-like uncharacterized protein